MCRVAEIIAPRHPEASPDELRALGVRAGWHGPPSSSRCCSSTPRSAPELDLDDPEPERAVAPSRSRPTSSTRCATSTSRPLAPKAVLHVHLHEAALHGTDAVARVEGFGPVTLTRLTELLRRFDVQVQPVKDLSDRVRYTAYEHPESLKRPGPPDHRRRLLALRHLHQPQRRPRPPHSLRPRHRPGWSRTPAGPDRLPQLRPPRPTTPPLEDPRGLPVTPVRRRPLRLAHPPRARASSSTTPAPTASTPKRPG